MPLHWGPRGLNALAVACDGLIIVDVLSFGTAVDIALTAGATVFPCRSHEEAGPLASKVHGLPAVRRGESGFSLSPASLLGLPRGSRFVLPSVNGGALAAGAARGRRDLVVFVACVRNAGAVADAAREFSHRPGLVAAGEIRRDGSIRFAWEDWIGAGAVAEALRLPLTPRAAQAAASFRAARGDLERALRATRSGCELAERGFTPDVRLAAEAAASTTVPQIEGTVLVPGPRAARGTIAHRWFDGARLVALPARQGERRLVLAEVLRRLDLPPETPEARLNELLKVMHPDVCTLRRELVDAGLLSRARGIYRRGANAS